MKSALSSRAGLAAALALAASSVKAHSWIESAFLVAPNGTYLGGEGFPRGYVPRTDPGFSDKVAQHQIPDGGVYKGDEVLNKYPLDPNPKHPLLLATPGSQVAIRHLENGHVTLPQAQAHKPLNRGTVYLYGTTEPKEQEKLFDVHLVWNPDGSGGDKRGRLLATRNYDDGQCFQDNKQAMAQERASKMAGGGAKVEKELKCQSTITIPQDIKPGSVYTVYWYWDWPTLNPGKIDMQATKQGQFPWGGSFKRRDKVPNNWTADDIVVNESYSSVIDIKITEEIPGLIAKQAGNQTDWIDKQNIYSQGIKAQMVNKFDVPIDNLGLGSGGGGAVKPSPVSGAPSAPASGAPAPSASSAPASGAPAPPAPSAPAVAGPPTPGAQAPPAAANPAASAAPGLQGPSGSSIGAPEPSNNIMSSVRMPVPSSNPLSSMRMPVPVSTGVSAPPADAVKPSNAVVTETVTVPPTTVVQTVYVTETPRRRAKRARAPTTTMVTRTKMAPIPVGTPVTPSQNRNNAAGRKPAKLAQ